MNIYENVLNLHLRIFKVFQINMQDMNTEYWLSVYQEKLKEQRYSEASIIHYLNVIRHFLEVSPARIQHPKDITPETIEKYILWLIRNKRISFSYQRQVVVGIGRFYELVLGVKLPLKYLKPQFPENKLPQYLSREEVRHMIDVTENLKHKCILCLLYSGGLRLKELVNLKVSDIDSKSQVIHIAQTKNSRDRVVMLSLILLRNLRLYYREYRPKVYLFEGQGGGKYSNRSVQQVVKSAAQRSQIKNAVSPHILRHSFATHLLENGTDIRFIKDLLGHQSIRTTGIYNLISKISQTKIISPLDSLLINER